MAEVFANPLAELAEYTDMKQDMDKGKGPIQVSGVTDSQKVHVMQELSKEHPWRLVVTYDDNRAKEIYDDFSYFEPNTWLYPARDLLFYSSDIHGNLLTRQRMQVFKHLLEDEGGVVVTTVDGLMDHLLPLSMLRESCLTSWRDRRSISRRSRHSSRIWAMSGWDRSMEWGSFLSAAEFLMSFRSRRRFRSGSNSGETR